MQEAIERIYWDHRQGLYTLALAITRCPARAEDAVQEAFARLWSTQARPGGDPTAYAFAAVRNAAIDQVRRKEPATCGPEAASIFASDAPDPAYDAIASERQRNVRDAVDALPEAEREVVVMKIYSGLTFEQIAQALAEPLPTVASRYRRALEKLSRRIRTGEVNSHA